MEGYKHVIEDKDKIINRVVLKSKQFRTNDISTIEAKVSKSHNGYAEDDELEQSKRFL